MEQIFSLEDYLHSQLEHHKREESNMLNQISICNRKLKELEDNYSNELKQKNNDLFDVYSKSNDKLENIAVKIEDCKTELLVIQEKYEYSTSMINSIDSFYNDIHELYVTQNLYNLLVDKQQKSDELIQIIQKHIIQCLTFSTHDYNRVKIELKNILKLIHTNND